PTPRFSVVVAAPARLPAAISVRAMVSPSTVFIAALFLIVSSCPLYPAVSTSPRLRSVNSTRRYETEQTHGHSAGRRPGATGCARLHSRARLRWDRSVNERRAGGAKRQAPVAAPVGETETRHRP